MLQTIWDFLNGKKTYALALLGSLFGVLVALHVFTGEQADEISKLVATGYDQVLGVLMTLISLLAAALRHGVSKNDPPADANHDVLPYSQRK